MFHLLHRLPQFYEIIRSLLTFFPKLAADRERQRGADFTPLRLWNLIISQFYKHTRQEAFVSMETLFRKVRAPDSGGGEKWSVGVRHFGGAEFPVRDDMKRHKKVQWQHQAGRLKWLCRLRFFGARGNYGKHVTHIRVGESWMSYEKAAGVWKGLENLYGFSVYLVFLNYFFLIFKRKCDKLEHTGEKPINLP